MLFFRRIFRRKYLINYSIGPWLDGGDEDDADDDGDQRRRHEEGDRTAANFPLIEDHHLSRKCVANTLRISPIFSFRLTRLSLYRGRTCRYVYSYYIT
jgi:hypothetical protein